jgi:tRNA (cmo5U34)-methyltransferase
MKKLLGGYLIDFKIDNMDIHFNECASDYDRHFYEDLGMREFYDEIEKQIDISSGMLAELKKKEFYPQVLLNTICNSCFDVPLALDTELALLSDIGFNSISVERRWNKTALIKALK